MKLVVEVISQELIKPSSPTPDHLRRYQLSFLDQIQVPVFMPLVLFYQKETNTTNIERCNLIKQSLSETLTKFYPLAGRVKDNLYINCNDEGVHFVEARANCQLLHVLENKNPDDNNKFLPFELDDVRDLAACFQVTFFECGGLAIAFGMSHKVGDALSYFIFLNSWAAIAFGNNDIHIPSFDSAKLFPPRNISGFQPTSGIVKNKIITKRFVFDASTIAALREKYTYNNDSVNNKSQRPTRVEALSAFIWSRFMATTQANKLEADKIYTVLHAVNLRPRMDPPLSDQYFGNISRLAITVVNKDAKDLCHGMLKQMREAIRDVNTDYIKRLQQSDMHLNFMKERGEMTKKGEVISLNFTSLCRFPMYEADFGWGKPVWVGSACLTFKNLVTFFDTKEGNGIEAWIHLKEEDMAKFGIDNQLLHHVSTNPITKI